MINKNIDDFAEIHKRRQLEMEMFGKLPTANITLHNADCRDVLDKLKPNSVHSAVTDSPFHLISAKNVSKGYMDMKWDGGDIAFQVELWKKVLSVLKPGGHALAFGHPRTYHRMACSMEDAGFEITDTFFWLYGTHMSTSHNISKAIDKKANATRNVIGQVDRGNRRQFAEGHSGFKKGIVDITEPATDAAKQWDGWGTKVRSSSCPIVVARKPIEGTIAENVLRHNTGGLNLDACRLPNGNLPTNTIISETVAAVLKNKAPFFYCPKPSREERHRGCEHIVGPKQTDASVAEKGNYHNTVKPIALMEYLVKLVTPQDGICLDIFGGSATTVLACLNLGIDCILIEKDKGYFEIAKARVAYAQGKNPSDAA